MDDIENKKETSVPDSSDVRPRCTACGEPARYVSAPAVVRFHLEPDGTMNHVFAVGKADPHEHKYVCGGGHTWVLKSTEPKLKTPPCHRNARVRVEQVGPTTIRFLFPCGAVQTKNYAKEKLARRLDANGVAMMMRLWSAHGAEADCPQCVTPIPPRAKRKAPAAVR